MIRCADIKINKLKVSPPGGDLEGAYE